MVSAAPDEHIRPQHCSLPSPSVPVGGSLAHLAEKWEEITDYNLLPVIRKGYTIRFHTSLMLSNRPIHLPVRNQSHASLLLTTINVLLETGSRNSSRSRSLATSFSCKKRNVILRPIIDVSTLKYLSESLIAPMLCTY